MREWFGGVNRTSALETLCEKFPLVTRWVFGLLTNKLVFELPIIIFLWLRFAPFSLRLPGDTDNDSQFSCKLYWIIPRAAIFSFEVYYPLATFIG
jgi:hypothetical protein